MNTKNYVDCIHFGSHNSAMTKHNSPPSTFSVRIPADMRKQLEDFARIGGRSLHAEILLRLDHSLKSQANIEQTTNNDDDERIKQIVDKAIKEAFTKAGIKLADS